MWMMAKAEEKNMVWVVMMRRYDPLIAANMDFHCFHTGYMASSIAEWNIKHLTKSVTQTCGGAVCEGSIVESVILLAAEMNNRLDTMATAPKIVQVQMQIFKQSSSTRLQRQLPSLMLQYVGFTGPHVKGHRWLVEDVRRLTKEGDLVYILHL
jgi:hypothetical protein